MSYRGRYDRYGSSVCSFDSCSDPYYNYPNYYDYGYGGYYGGGYPYSGYGYSNRYYEGSRYLPFDDFVEYKIDKKWAKISRRHW